MDPNFSLMDYDWDTDDAGFTVAGEADNHEAGEGLAAAPATVTTEPVRSRPDIEATQLQTDTTTFTDVDAAPSTGMDLPSFTWGRFGAEEADISQQEAPAADSHTGSNEDRPATQNAPNPRGPLYHELRSLSLFNPRMVEMFRAKQLGQTVQLPSGSAGTLQGALNGHSAQLPSSGPVLSDVGQEQSTTTSPAPSSVMSPGERADLLTVDPTADDEEMDVDCAANHQQSPAAAASTTMPPRSSPLATTQQPQTGLTPVTVPAPAPTQNALAHSPMHTMPQVLRFGSAAGARFHAFRYQTLDIEGDDVSQVQQNEPQWVRTLMQALLSVTYKEPPHKKGTERGNGKVLDEEEIAEWDRWQIAAVQKCVKAGAPPKHTNFMTEIEAFAWSILEQCERAHTFGCRLGACKLDTVSKCSVRVEKAVAVINDYAAVRLAIIEGQANLELLAANPVAFAQAKINNVWNNLRKRQVAAAAPKGKTTTPADTSTTTKGGKQGSKHGHTSASTRKRFTEEEIKSMTPAQRQGVTTTSTMTQGPAGGPSQDAGHTPAEEDEEGPEGEVEEVEGEEEEKEEEEDNDVDVDDDDDDLDYVE